MVGGGGFKVTNISNLNQSCIEFELELTYQPVFCGGTNLKVPIVKEHLRYPMYY